MVEDKDPPRPSPYLTAGWLSKITFWWIIDTITAARKMALTTYDVHDAIPEAQSQPQSEAFERRWQNLSGEERNSKGSLFKQLLIHYKKDLLMALLLELVTECIRFTDPVLIVALLRHLHEKKESNTIAYIYVVLMVVGILIKTICFCHFNTWTGIIAMKMRSTCLAMIYKKVLKKSIGDSRETGYILTLMSSDVESFHYALNFLPHMILSPVLLAAFIVTECFTIGYFTALLAVLLIVTILCHFGMGILTGKLRTRQEIWTDKRVQLMNEIITGMKIIKIYCWENMYSDIARKLRRTEMAIGLKRSLIIFIRAGLSFGLPKVIILVTLTAYTLLGHVLTLEIIIFTIGWIKAMYWTVMVCLPTAFHVVQESIVATDRIKDFVMSDELCGGFLVSEGERLVNIKIKNGFSDWSLKVSAHRRASVDDIFTISPHCKKCYTLFDINISLGSGKLVAIVGPVGAGKSSLLMAILGELPLLSGQKEVYGTVGYVPQESWLLPDTVRQNVIFNNAYDEERYSRVMRACSLDEDVKNFPQKDLSLIGERGLCLSGGQKARINLARALYQDKDIYLFDDPLSALDAKVGKNTFQRCMLGLLRGKMRVLVTHQLQYLPYVDEIIVMNKGCITRQGTYATVASELQLVPDVDVAQTEHLALVDEAETNTPQDQSGKVFGLGKYSPEEKDEIGSVSYKIYLSHLSAGMGKVLVPAMIICMLVTMGSDITSDWMMTTWDKMGPPSVNNSASGMIYLHTVDGLWYITVWSLAGGYLLFLTLFNVFPALMLTLASRNVYDKMFDRILHAPSYFFETNPVGQVLNRFTRDTYFMDVNLQLPSSYIIQVMSFIISYMIYVCILNPWMILATVGYLVLVSIIFHFLIGAIRQTKRLEASLRSPLFSHLSSTLQGLPVIRSMQKERSFMREAFKLIDQQTSAWFMYIMTTQFLGLCFDLPACIFTGLYLVLTIFLFHEDQDVGATALGIVYLLNTFDWLQYAMKKVAEVECMMTSVERIKQYSVLEQESAAYTDVRPPKHWPSTGTIQLCDMSLTYRGQDEPALGPLSLTIEAHQKVGVVGRTGAGKSSLIVSLLRLVEPAGSVRIDDVELGTLGLADVRSNISVIPQDPLLFSGTIRKNLDCSAEHSDEAIWRAIEQVQLKQKVKRLVGGLSAEAGDGGSNFSVGQRQLLCMARALLRRNKVVIIDEATANVDNRTDANIQEILSKVFSRMTVLTVAHRLNTIIKYDKVLVLEKGTAVQFDHPHILLQDTRGVFYQLLKNLGEDHFKMLQKMAADAYYTTSTWL